MEYTSTSLWAIHEITQLIKCHAPGVCQVNVCRNVTHWEELEDGSFVLVNEGFEYSSGWSEMWDSEDEDEDGLRPDTTIRQLEQKAMYKGIEEMVGEITWLKDLTVTGFEKIDPAWPKVERLQAIVKSRR